MEKLFLTTTIPATFVFFTDTLRVYNECFDVHVISSKREGLEQFACHEGVDWKVIPMSRPISLRMDLSSLWNLICYFRKEHPTIVHGNTPKAGLLSMIAAWITRVPVRIYMCHGLRHQGTQGLLHRVLVLTEKIACKCATEVIPVSFSVRDALIKDGICPARKVRVIGSGSCGGIDITWFSREKLEASGISGQVRSQLGIPSSAFVFLFIGRLVGDKGINELIAAFSKVQHVREDCYLILVGREEKDLDPMSEATCKAIEMNSHIFRVGLQEDVRPYFLDADALTLPSYREGLNQVIIEAGAMEVPVITTDAVGCKELVEIGETGEVVPVRNTEALATMMKTWAQTDPETLREWGRNARKNILSKYDRKIVVENMLAEYKRLVEAQK